MVAMTTDTSDVSSFLRGKLFLGGVGHDTPLPVTLDVITTLVVDVPRDTLEEWRGRFDAALAGAPMPTPRPRAADPAPARTPRGPRPPEVADRATWGLLPAHQAELKQMVATATGQR